MSVELSHVYARALQHHAVDNMNDLLIWTICAHPKDFPKSFVARPHSTKYNKALDYYLLDETLEGLRAKLPTGLTRIERAPQDDPVIVETWI
jgi:hypothetical protein